MPNAIAASWLVLPLLAVLGCTAAPTEAPATPPSPDTAKRAIAAVLDDFHRAASEPDEGRYFAHFAVGGVFLGTDPAERWTVEQFRAYAHERFSTGKGWTYVPSERHVDLAEDGRAAWFDEVVTNDKYGACRGTGVMVYIGDSGDSQEDNQGGTWKIAQYSLSLPLPNDMFRDVAEKVRAFVPE